MTVLPVAGSTFTFGVSLEDQANAGLFKAGPTIAAGDFQRSINGGAFANLDNLPTVTPAAGVRVQIVLSAAETTSAAAGGNIYVRGVDASGDEWYDTAIEVRVAAAEIATVGAEMDLVDAPNATAVYAIQYGLATVDNLIALLNGINSVAARLGFWTGGGVNTVLGAFQALLRKDASAPSDIGGTFSPATDSAEAISEAVALLSGAAGSGAISFPITVNDEDSNPIDGVEVWVTTDSAGTNVVAGTLSTDALGLTTFMLDAGSYYVWRQKSGYNFTNPVSITVS